MTKTLPKIEFKSGTELDIEVMTLKETYLKLSKIHDHDPFSPHKIQFYLILVIVKGSYKHYVDFNFYDLQEGSLLFVSKNQMQYFSENLAQVKGYSIIINSRFLERNYFLSKNINLNRLYNYHLESPIIHREEMDGDNFDDIASKLYQEYHFPNGFAKGEMLRALLHVLLLKAERIKESTSISVAKTHWLEMFTSFKNLLHNEYVNTRNSRYYASQLTISYKFLNDVVKKLTGKTAKTFIDDFVVIEIKRYLVSTSLSVKEISYKTGFE